MERTHFLSGTEKVEQESYAADKPFARTNEVLREASFG
jgi:hypothetical protein